MINRRRSGARGTPAKVNATAGLAASEGLNSVSISDGSHESVYLCPFYVTPPFWFVLPSLPMFLVIPAMLNRGAPFWLALTAGCLLTIALYLAMTWVGPRFGLRL